QVGRGTLLPYVLPGPFRGSVCVLVRTLADLDLPFPNPHLIRGLRRGGRPSKHRAVLETEGAQMPGAGDAPLLHRSLVQWPAPMGAPVGHRVDPVTGPI